jgi:hypothetical protein
MKSKTLVVPLVLAAAMLLVTVAPALAGYPGEPPAGPAKLPPVAKFYEKIILGYEGAGRARYDLTDPDDGLPGINLAGLTDGNITLTIGIMCAIFAFAKGRCPD